jgi:enterochelin esterase family protein
MTETLLERARRTGTPIIDGDTAIFVWAGDGDPPLLIGDFTDWSASPMPLTEDSPGVWTARVTLPADAYVEYSFVHRYRTPDAPREVDERVADPFNPRVIWNGLKAVNHQFAMPGFTPSPLTVRDTRLPRGTMSEHTLDAGMLLSGAHRSVALYQPPVSEPVPLVVVWDGADYLQRAALNIIVDNLIAAGRIRPIALAMIDNAGAGRFSEYAMSESTVGFAVRTLLPFAGEHLRLLDAVDAPGCHGVMGASMGGLMALYTGLRAPKVFGHVISQSGAFFIDPTRQTMLIDDLIRLQPTAPLRIWQDVGTIEWLLEGNRAMHALLVERGYDVTYHEYNGGHNYFMWSQMAGRALEAVYGAG